MPDSADPLPSPTPHEFSTAAAAVKPDPDMPPRKPSAGGGKLKRPLTDKLRAAAEQRLAHLRAHLRLHPLAPPPRALAPAASPHEAALAALGLLDFARLDLHADSPRPDLVAPLVAYYDPAQRRSFVRGVRVSVSRRHFADALSLPSKPSPTAAAPPPDVDPAAVVAAALELMQECILLPFQGDDMCILPQEVAAAEQAVREGSAHRVDWAGLIWGLVEKEMLDLPKRDDAVCYFGPYLQRLILAQKPVVFEPTAEEERVDVILEVSDTDDEDADANLDAKNKSLEELEPEVTDPDASGNCLGEMELGVTDFTGGNSLEELECGDADGRTKTMEGLELGVEDTGSKRLEELGSEDVDMGLDESDAVDENVKGENFDESGLGFLSVETASVTHELMPADGEDSADVAPEGDEDIAGASLQNDAGPLLETVIETQEEIVSVPEEDEEEDWEGEKDAMGLSLGIGSANDYDSMDAEDDANVENLDEGDSSNKEDQESDDDAFEECRGGEEANWRVGDGGMAHALQPCDSSAYTGMEFGNLNKVDVEMRNEVSFDDGFSEKMGSLHGMPSTNLLQAMNSIPATYSENAPDLSGDFLAMGTDTHKNGLDLGTGNPFYFGNNGKRHIGDIEAYNDHLPTEEQYPQGNQQKRLRNSNDSTISPGSAIFNAKFLDPIQNSLAKASMLFEQTERENQTLREEKQYFANLVQEKDSIIQSINSSRFEQQNMWQAELRRFEHDLNVMAQLVTGYKMALKQSRASFNEYRKKFPCDKPRYCDVPGGGGLVLSVKELERKRWEEQQQKLAAANEMIEKFQHEWFSKLDEMNHATDNLRGRLGELFREVGLLQAKTEAKVATRVTEE